MSTRIRSIDIFRALTMCLMIFVNDLWTLSGIPGWLGHTPTEHDGMGLADVVFPAFLFIVGLSIPYAISNRQRKGDTRLAVLRHIAERSLALIIMGLFMVNIEYAASEDLIIGKPLWQILMTGAFFLIWNVYPDRKTRIPTLTWRLAGWALLLFLAVIYRGPETGGHQWMHFHWWGILGLIGWAYLLGALVSLSAGKRSGWIAGTWLLLLILNINEFYTPFSFQVKLVVSASNHFLVMSGILVTHITMRVRPDKNPGRFLALLAGLALLLFAFGFLTRPEWGISKNLATPSWTAICAAISVLCFGLLYLMADRMKLTRWADILAPAGTMTLTCYLLPNFIYPIRALTGLHLPPWFVTGMPGLLKSLLFALIVIQLTGMIGKRGVKLKI